MSNLFPNVLRRIIHVHAQQIRWLPRWSHRQPVQVIPADQYDSARDTQIRSNTPIEDPQTTQKINWKHKPSSFKPENEAKTDPSLQYKLKTPKNPKPLTIKKTKTSIKATVDMLETLIDKDGNFIYTKMNNNDSRIGSILVDLKSKKEKEKRDLILLEGKRLIKDALDAGCKLEYILFSRMKEVEYLKSSLPKIGAKLYKMPYKEMQMWSGLTTNPGIMGIFKAPDTESITPPVGSLPLTIICDNVREPNNLGAILRTCSGVGCEKVVLTKGCVNVWDSKVLRSASGAHFKLQISKKLDWDLIKEKLFPNSRIYIADNRAVSMTSSTNAERDDLAELLQTVPILPYYGVDFSNDSHVVLIVGGETEGVSEESYRLASEFKGVRLNIPLINNVDSLNTGTALGIIVFEVKRQLSILQKELPDKSEYII